jgi:hypothetical protein
MIVLVEIRQFVMELDIAVYATPSIHTHLSRQNTRVFRPMKEQRSFAEAVE